MLAKLPLTISGNRLGFPSELRGTDNSAASLVGEFVGLDQDPIERPLERLRKPRVGAVLGDLGRQLNGYNWPMLSFFAFILPIIPGREIQHVRAMGYGGAMRLAQLTGMIDKTQRAIDLLLMPVEEQVDVRALSSSGPTHHRPSQLPSACQSAPDQENA